MNILEKIKQILFKNKQKALPESTISSENTRSSFLSNIRHVTTPRRKDTVKNKYLENCISQFFEELKRIPSENLSNFGSPLFYQALVRINALNGNSYSNTEHEDKLIDEINNSYNYELLWQHAGKNNTPVFYHIRDRFYLSPDPNNMVRMYLNCKNENVAKLASCLLQYNTHPQFYLKACSSEYLAANKRSEKIVVYSTYSQLQYHMSLINHAREEHPELFEGSEKTNPFMPSNNGIAFAKQPISRNFTLLDGSTIEIGQSSNSFIAQTIQESYIETLRELSYNDSELEFLLDPENINDDSLYAGTYDYVNSHHHAKLINSMEEKMKVLCDLNNIEINGINYTRNLENSESEISK